MEGEEEQEEANEAELSKKRKKAQAASAKQKGEKGYARKRSRRKRRDSDSNSDDDDDGSDDDLNHVERRMRREKLPPIGQIENCETCGKRFTATVYSGTGPEGGLLCPSCSRDQANKNKKPASKRAGPKSNRRKNQSSLLDGVAAIGVPSLVDTCVKVS